MRRTLPLSSSQCMCLHLCSLTLLAHTVCRCSNGSNLFPDLFVQVWIVGEYTHSGYDSRCTSSLLVELFEVTFTLYFVLCTLYSVLYFHCVPSHPPSLPSSLSLPPSLTASQTLEPVTYEVALNLHRQRDYTTRLMLVLMGSVAKIASRCHDLIPRALLCLNKIVQLGKVGGREGELSRLISSLFHSCHTVMCT